MPLSKDEIKRHVDECRAMPIGKYCPVIARPADATVLFIVLGQLALKRAIKLDHLAQSGEVMFAVPITAEHTSAQDYAKVASRYTASIQSELSRVRKKWKDEITPASGKHIKKFSLSSQGWELHNSGNYVIVKYSYSENKKFNTAMAAIADVDLCL